MDNPHQQQEDVVSNLCSTSWLIPWDHQFLVFTTRGVNAKEEVPDLGRDFSRRLRLGFVPAGTGKQEGSSNLSVTSVGWAERSACSASREICGTQREGRIVKKVSRKADQKQSLVDIKDAGLCGLPGMLADVRDAG